MTTDEPTNLRLDQIRIDGGTQPRVEIDQDTVADYVEKYSTAQDLPPVDVFHDGATYWLADGFHRYWANRKINSDYIYARVHQGTQREAILYSVGANATHGLRRKNEDKRKAVLTLLKDEEWSAWSDREIAKHCGVGNEMVSRIRRSLCESHSENPPGRSLPEVDIENRHRTYKTKHGTSARMRTGKIGRTKKGSRSRRPSAAISPDASMPTRQTGEFKPRVNIDIPHDPNAAARVIRSVLGDDFARNLIDELNSLLRF